MLGFAWPCMTFVSVDDLKLVIMANVWPPWYPKSLTYLKTPLLKVHLSVTTTLQRQSRYLLDYT